MSQPWLSGMFMTLSALLRYTAFCLLAFPAFASQESTPAAKPSEHLIGTVANADASGQSVTLKEDGAGIEHVIHLGDTKTLLKVAPGAKDLKSATRIKATDLAPGDRIDVRGFKVDGEANAIAARSVVLMSGRELQQVHQEEAMAWRRSTAGTVTAIDQSNGTLTISARTSAGLQPVAVTTANAAFTRYSPEHPKVAIPSKLSDVQPGDQVRVVGEKADDGTTIAAQRIYSGSFRTIAATISSLAADGKSMVVKDLATKQSVTVTLGQDSLLRKLPPMMAAALARRLNPDARTASSSGTQAGAGEGGAPGTPRSESRTERAETQTPGGQPPQRNPQGPGGGWDRSNAKPGGGAPGGFHGGRGGNGDLSQMLDRLPPITAADLKPGDALIVSGSPSATDKATLMANSVVAGVEPILQSASPRQAQSLGDWGSLGAGPGADSGGPQ